MFKTFNKQILNLNYYQDDGFDFKGSPLKENSFPGL